MSIVTNSQGRGSIPLGKRQTPQISPALQQERHVPLTPQDIARYATEAREHMIAYLRTVYNPSFDDIERHVLTCLKQSTPAFDRIRWHTQLPVGIQSEIKTIWRDRWHFQPSQTVSHLNGNMK